VGCRNNLARIGVALALFDQMNGHLPEIGPPGSPDETAGPGSVSPSPSPSPSPLKMMLETLQLPDLTELRDRTIRPNGRPGQVPGEVRVPGFICAGDPNALSGRTRAPISYRAVTGDNPRGDNGAFAPGLAPSLAAIEARDGLGHTAAFSERLVGDGRAGHVAAINYQVVPPPLSSTGCPRLAGPAAWRGDAGSSWLTADYRSTLSNHALPPNGQPSCVAADGRKAVIGASSGPVDGGNLHQLHGSVSLVRPSIHPKIWRDYATIGAVPERD
jgi:hypothetical protein